MDRGERMCPNVECEHSGKPTRFLGGCHCGTALVPFAIRPTDEQLEKTMTTMGVPTGWRA